jgi:hypothetical protein
MKVPLAIAGFVSILPTAALGQTVDAREAPAELPPPPPGETSPAPARTPAVTPPPWGSTAPANARPAPPYMLAYRGGPIPNDYRLEVRRDDQLLAFGATLFGALYLGSALGALACVTGPGCKSGMEWLFAPVVGPFAALAFAQTADSRATLVFDGLAQTAGVAMVIIAFSTTREFLVRNLRKDHSESHGFSWGISPGAPGATAGLSFSMTNL